MRGRDPLRSLPLHGVLGAAVVVAALVAACARPGGRGPARAGAKADEVSSNVTFADYAGTSACARCHASHVASWTASPMHNMTRDAATARVRGPFDGTTFRFKDDAAKFETAGGQRFVTVSSRRFGTSIYRLTRVIGGHYREDYAGIPVSAVGASAKPLGDPTEEVVMPVSWVFGEPGETAGDVADGPPKGHHRYKGYSVMLPERPALKAGPVWNQTCIFCHNTVPYESTVFGALAGPAARAYQGEVVDPLLPPDKRAKYTIVDRGAFAASVRTEIERLGGEANRPTAAAAVAVTRARFRAEHLVEVGIGCEACHLGSAEHVRDPSRLPSFVPRGAGIEVTLPADTRAARINRTCARCHQVLFSRYEPTWEGGGRSGHPGGSQINSGEARDLLLGACTSKLSCVECHDPHAANATASLRAQDAAGADRLCTRCHSALATPTALRAHAHHEPAQVRCLDCHMPRKNMGLDGNLTRYHRIGSPTDAPRVLLDRPLECALCHERASVEELTGAMERWWNKAYDREALKLLYGALDANVIRATAERGRPHEQAVAFAVLGRARVQSAEALLTGQLTHSLPIVRGYAKRALDAIVGAPVPVDIQHDVPAIEAEVGQWRKARDEARLRK